ncbi:MAG TPA: hypothetical protein VMT57_04015 [Candidatus Thermoplasmatota archaeon]|nr:hypothetical protein [Candidatus Thermoplasmatota archaeon]
MISLKRNDKIIILVAIVIIVIAGVGIAMYTQPATVSTPPPAPTSSQSFNVSWVVRNASLDTITGFAGKRASYSGGIEIDQGNIISVTFNMSWVDDHTTFLKHFGLDRLTLAVTAPDGIVYQVSNTSAPKTRAGTDTVVLVSGLHPPTDPIKADDYPSAQAQLMKKPYLDDSWMKKNLSFTVSDRIGEKRILPRLLDKGNSFTLVITYQYYQGIIQQGQVKSTGNDNDNAFTQSSYEPPYMSMIINTGCGRFV